MGSGASKNTEEDDDGSNGGGGQLYVSLKMENSKVEGELTPHVYGSLPLIGSWDPSKAVSICLIFVLSSSSFLPIHSSGILIAFLRRLVVNQFFFNSFRCNVNLR